DSATLTIVDNDTPPPAPGETITLEAENLNLTNYRLESNSVASGGELITLLGSGSDTGTATAHFNGASGTYNVKITFFDENDGEGEIAVNIGSNQANLVLDDNLGTGGVKNRNQVSEQIFTNVEISNGELITITGNAEAGEWARVDKIEFIPVGDTPPPTPNPGVIDFSANNFSLSENGTPVQEVTLNRTGGTQGQVSVTLTPTNGTATNADYDDNPIVVTFADGETSKTVDITLVDDSEVEGNETINLDLSNPTGGVTIGNSDSATLTIVDNDTPPPAPGETITLEAENLNLTNYRLESNSVASGGKLITLLGSGSDTGTATAHFNGASGTYNVEITFFDENDGEGNLAVNIGSNQASLLLNDNLGSGGVTNNNKVTTQIFSNVEISNGELITITGNAEAAELDSSR
ncbi:MAG: hypothetical protein F6K09_36075, partial [Merismopedia sp. SIO2A8]|nr:hypothetical protein [Merismopedia sp. SIO2A8]